VRSFTCDKVLILFTVAVDGHETGVELCDGWDMVLHDTERTVGGWHDHLETESDEW